MIEQDVNAWLKNNTQLKALVGANIFYTAVPQDAQFPCITMPVSGKSGQYTQDGDSTNKATFTFNCHCHGYDEEKTYLECKELVGVLTDLLSGFTGQLGLSNTFIQACFVQTEQDQPFYYWEGKSGGTQTITLTAELWY